MPKALKGGRLLAALGLGMLGLGAAACSAKVDVPASAVQANAAFVASLPAIDPAAMRDLFDYDRSAPLNVHEIRSWNQAEGIWIDLTYDSPLGGKVPATLVIPNSRGPSPANVLMHGMPADRTTMYDLAASYARLGIAAVMIDAPFNRPGNADRSWIRGMPLTFTEQDAADQIQLIVDLRRAVDLLVTHPEVDPQRLAYVGLSYGGAMGGLLAGVEDRLSAYVLQVGDGGLVTHLTGYDDKVNHYGSPFYMLTADRQQAWLDAMWPLEPIHYVAGASPAALLFQNGTMDSAVPASDAARYQQAASEPKDIRWYESGHWLPPAAQAEAAAWLTRQLRPGMVWLVPHLQSWAIWADRLLSLWFATGLVCAAAVAWRLWSQPRLAVIARLHGIALALLLGPIGLLALVVPGGALPHPSSARTRMQQAMLNACLPIPGAVLGLLLAMGIIVGAGVTDAIAQLVVAYLLPMVIALVYGRLLERRLGAGKPAGGWPYQPLAERAISINFALAGMMLLTIVIPNRINPFGFTGSLPVLWMALHSAAIAGLLLGYPVNLVMSAGSTDSQISSQAVKARPRRLRWYQALAGLAVSLASVVAANLAAIAIVVGLRIPELLMAIAASG